MEACGKIDCFCYALFNPYHPHCQTCIKVLKCSVRPKPGESCEIITCDLDCGARFHACKKSEHLLLCANEKVPCVNSVSGCPVQMLRKEISGHLEICPASVVHCTMEWNRWPVHVSDRQLTRQPHQPLNQMQLDVALALRDQRMLKQLWHAPRRTRRALRNSLTEKYPPVPLNPCKGAYETEGGQDSNYTSHTASDDESDTPWEVRKTPPGLESSVCGQLYRASRQASETLTAALAMINNHSIQQIEDGSTENPSKEVTSSGHHTEKCNLHDEDKENLCLNTQHCKCQKIENHKYENGSIISEDSLSECHPMIPVSDELSLQRDILLVDSAIVSGISSTNNTQPFAVDPTQYVMSSPSIMCHQSSVVHINPPLAPPPPFVSLGLDLNLESITRYQAKPKSMYTFLCAQEFRRDEYAWHYKNVHSDIHGGLNGWLEQRCPLAQYGCVFSRKRFYPSPKGSVIVHNDILESFGVQPPLPTNLSIHNNHLNKKNSRRPSGRMDKSACQRKGSMDVIHELESCCKDQMKSRENSSSNLSLTQLPFEVLRHIARYLDGFSLCNLSLTCCLLREVCCSLLDERGIVVLQWERRKVNDKYSWQVAYKRWFFSTAFTPIKKWHFADDNNMLNHLQTCPFFNRNIKTDPYFYPMGPCPNMNIYRKMKNSSAVKIALESEPGNMTKL